MLSAVVGASSSLEVWQTLSRQFGIRSRSKVLHLRTQIQTTRKRSMSVHEYYTKMKMNLDSLRAAGNHMSNDDFVLCLLAGFGPEYDLIVATINAKSESITPSEVYGMLLSQENRIEYQNSVSSIDYQANIAYYRGNQRRNWQSNFNNTGNVANQSGRQFGNNYSGGNFNPIQEKMKGKASTDEEAPKGPCQICFRKNHIAVNCWYMFKKNYVPNFAGNKRSAYVVEGAETKSGGWYLDSRATDHVTNDLNNLSISS